MFKFLTKPSKPDTGDEDVFVQYMDDLYRSFLYKRSK